MRTTAFTLAFLTVASVAFQVNAQDDFSALLADLSFSDLPELSEPLEVAVSEPAESLKPAPELVMPANKPVESKAVPSKAVAAPQVALQDPIPVTQPEPVDVQIDMEAAFALQEIGGSAPVAAQSVGHLLHRQNSQACDCANENIMTCTPHVKPSLPSSTLYQYFRSNKCHTNVWDGYRQPCGAARRHVDGRCDCFSKGQIGCSTGQCSDCVSCDGGCDR